MRKVKIFVWVVMFLCLGCFLFWFATHNWCTKYQHVNRISGALYTGPYARLCDTYTGASFDINGDGIFERIAITPAITKDKDSFPEDWFTLSIRSEKESFTEYKEDLFSTYGIYDIQFYNIMGGKKEAIFLTLGSGRGTEVREETLTIKIWDNGKLTPIFSKQVSAFIGAGGHWQKRYEVADVNNDGFEDLIFFLEYDIWCEYCVDAKVIEFLNKKIEIYTWNNIKKEFVLSQ